MGFSSDPFLTKDERTMLKKTKKETPIDKRDLDLIYVNILDIRDIYKISRESNRIIFHKNEATTYFHDFNMNTFKSLLYKVCIEFTDLIEPIDYSLISEMNKQDLYFIHVYPTSNNVLQLASHELFQQMFNRERLTPYHETYQLIKSNTVDTVIRFLKYGATHPTGFEAHKWVAIAIKLLKQLNIKCSQDNRKLHNITLKEKDEQRMIEANTGGSKYEKKTVKELQQMCMKHNIKYSGLRKAELIKTLILHKIK